MRYSIVDLQCEDILWFALDVNGNILAFTSGGFGNVPEFICRSKEENELLIDFFNKYDASTTGTHLLIEDDGNPLSADARKFSQHGITCFDVDIDNDNPSYVKISYPDNPITNDVLPENIQKILSDHIVNVDVMHTDRIDVPHAYS